MNKPTCPTSQCDSDNYDIPTTSKRLNDATPEEWNAVAAQWFKPAEDENVNKVVRAYFTRADAGMNRYGVTTSANPLDLIEWLTHLQEELMDATIYIERTVEELEKGLRKVEQLKQGENN